MSLSRLPESFFNRNCVEVARDLLGKILVFGPYRGVITETEAYRGENDPACHAYRGKTPRNAVMFGPPGRSYVYFIYGMYYCLNIVTEPNETAAGVLIRGINLLAPAVEVLNGPGKLCRRLGITKEHSGCDLTSSDTFFVEGQVIERSEELKVDEVSLTGLADKKLEIFERGTAKIESIYNEEVKEGEREPERKGEILGAGSHSYVNILGEKMNFSIQVTKRIGIRLAADFPWRFLLQSTFGNEEVGRSRKKRVKRQDLEDSGAERGVEEGSQKGGRKKRMVT